MSVQFSIVGLGKLGASMAAAIASKGAHVIGVDVNRRTIEAINAGHAPVQETGLEELIAINRERIRATLDHREAILNSDVTFVVVPTPSDERGAFSLQYAARAFREIGHALRDKDDYHLVVLTSTVLPGSTRFGLLPILEKESGKMAGRDFGLCYSPEFIALGSVIHDFLNPDFVLIGEYDEQSGALLETCYRQILENNAPCYRMSIENAELAKIAVNSFITMKITFANVLAALCEQLPGGDVDVVTSAIGADSRIGHKYLKGALGYGGPCFPRDNIALGFIARALDCQAEQAEITDRINRSLPKRVVEILRPLVRKDTTVAILGLAYKPFSHVVEESQSIQLARMLSELGANVIGYDPLANETARAELGEQVIILDSLEDCLSRAEIVVIATPDPVFRGLRRTHFGGKEGMIVMDCWRILEKELKDYENVIYLPIGKSVHDEANARRLASLWDCSI
ncbi:MAG: nucleotide sugar dehydrogenase [Candidatus Methanomethylicaceae archaeon]